MHFYGGGYQQQNDNQGPDSYYNHFQGITATQTTPYYNTGPIRSTTGDGYENSHGYVNTHSYENSHGYESPQGSHCHGSPNDHGNSHGYLNFHGYRSDAMKHLQKTTNRPGPNNYNSATYQGQPSWI